jgi:hypothetical protein
MANEYEKIERVAWGTGYREDYCTDGSWDAAKQKVRDLLTNETLVYVDSSVIHQKTGNATYQLTGAGASATEHMPCQQSLRCNV